jgi:hypothetical protein
MLDHQEEETAGVSMMDLVVRGAQLMDGLGDPSVLREYAVAVRAAALAAGSPLLLASSSPGDRLVGAALMLGAGRIRGWRPGDTRVALCDVALTSGASLSAASAHVRALGACHVTALVLNNLGGLSEVSGVDEIVELRPEGRAVVEQGSRLAAV